MTYPVVRAIDSQAALAYVLDRVEVGGECWDWTGTLAPNGYGSAALRDGTTGAPVTMRAHRVAYEVLRGPIPAGLTLDHLCRNRRCVRPSHLEPVTAGENVLRGEGVSAKHARTTACPRGHEYTPDNTYVLGGRRTCRACHRAKERVRRERRSRG
jgi:hypothetical protein